MLKVAVTGNMGSGKTIVCEVFKSLGIPVFNADAAAAYELEYNPSVKDAVNKLLGNDAYISGKPNKKWIAERVFKDPKALTALNAILHPATIQHFMHWCAVQKSDYIIKESAILFESGTDKGVDKIITVTAPESLRMQRIRKRNPALTDDDIRNRLSHQMNEEEKVKRSDFVIINDEKHSVIEQVMYIHKSLTQ